MRSSLGNTLKRWLKQRIDLGDRFVIHKVPLLEGKGFSSQCRNRLCRPFVDSWQRAGGKFVKVGSRGRERRVLLSGSPIMAVPTKRIIHLFLFRLGGLEFP